MYANIKYGYNMLENITLPQWLPSVVIHKRDMVSESGTIARIEDKIV